MQHGKYRFIVGFLALPLGLYALFVVWPFIQSIYYSFTDWTGLSPEFKMVGFDNYSRLLDDEIFWKSLQHSLLFALLLPVVTIGLALFFAFMINVGGRKRKNGPVVSGVRGSSFYKIVYFFPQVLSIAIVALLFAFAYNPDSGAINSVLRGIGLGDVQPLWLGDPDLALWAVMAVLVWSTVGFFVVLFSAGMAPSRRRCTRRRCWTARAASPRSSASPCPCSGTPCSRAGSTWASSPWAPSRSRSCRS